MFNNKTSKPSYQEVFAGVKAEMAELQVAVPAQMEAARDLTATVKEAVKS